jgi:hypothetical protein
MIDKIMEPYYDILLSIFLGVFLIIMMNYMYDLPRIIIIEQQSEKFNNISNDKLQNNSNHQCNDLSIS